MTTGFSRRRIVALAAGVPIVALLGRGEVDAAAPKVTVHKEPRCGCGGGWSAPLKAEGLSVDVVETSAINRVRAKLGVPSELAACHTAEVDGYVIEGHVPAVAIRRLLSQRPDARGLAVPGMPVGSPGMEIEGSAPETYQVILFGTFGRRVFARFEGARELAS